MDAAKLTGGLANGAAAPRESNQWSLHGDPATLVEADGAVAIVHTTLRVTPGRVVSLRIDGLNAGSPAVLASRIFALGPGGPIYEVVLELDSPVFAERPRSAGSPAA